MKHKPVVSRRIWRGMALAIPAGILLWILIIVIGIALAGCASTWTSCTDPYADYPGCGDREG